jgi:hypothetical protein
MSLRPLLSALAEESKQHVRALVVAAILGLAAVAFASVGVAFATYALFETLRATYGVVEASLFVSALYFVVAAILFAVARQRGKPRRAPTAHSTPAPSPAAAWPASGAPQTAAIAMGLDLAKQMSPLQLTILAALSGFVAGRKI